MMKKQILNLFLVFFLVLASSLIANDEELFSKILKENQKITEFMLETRKETIPSIRALDESLTEYLVNAKENRLEVKRLKELIQKPNKGDFEKFKKNYSAFSVRLFKTMKKYRVSRNYNQFFCSITNAYWISEGKKVKNPYYPRRRSHGVIVED